MKNIHLITAIGWIVALLAVVVFGNREALRRFWREVEAIDGDDRRRLTLRRAPQGRSWLIHPATRHAMRGMTTGEVDVEWAARHHAKWVAEERGADTSGRAR